MKSKDQNFTLNKSKRKNAGIGISIILFIILFADITYAQKTMKIPMRDGIKLATDLYFPEGEAGPSLTYNFDGTASQPKLVPGRSYVLNVEVHHYFEEGVGMLAQRGVLFTIARPDGQT